MRADPAGVLTGVHYLDGDFACGEGAMAAGCRFVAGYPITPSTEVVERIARRFPMMGGTFIQMEDELASMAAVVGGAWSGTKTMTVTSGPGFSLMMENIGLAAMMETPCVVVNVQRAGPSTGLPTMVAQADMMQARWGSHGDYEIIAVSPQSPQEAFDLTIDAFNLAETWRVPVLVMMDECVGHMTEKVVIPSPEEIDIVPRTLTKKSPEEFLPYASGGQAILPVQSEAEGRGNGKGEKKGETKGTGRIACPPPGVVPEFARAGDGYRFHTTGLTHDERGYPVISVEAQDKNVRRLIEKIRNNVERIVRFEEDGTDDAEVVVVSYGITARVARMAIDMARAQGVRVGALRLVVVWPFPERRIRELADRVAAFVVPEINYGQMVLEVERNAHGRANVISVPHAGGAVHDPAVIAAAILRAVR